MFDLNSSFIWWSMTQTLSHMVQDPTRLVVLPKRYLYDVNRCLNKDFRGTCASLCYPHNTIARAVFRSRYQWHRWRRFWEKQLSFPRPWIPPALTNGYHGSTRRCTNKIIPKPLLFASNIHIKIDCLSLGLSVGSACRAVMKEKIAIHSELIRSDQLVICDEPLAKLWRYLPLPHLYLQQCDHTIPLYHRLPSC